VSMTDRAMKVFKEYCSHSPVIVDDMQRVARNEAIPDANDRCMSAFTAIAILTSIDSGICCRLSTSLVDYLSEMTEPKGFTFEYTGPKLIGFRFQGSEFLAVRIELDKSKGWMIISNSGIRGWILDHLPAVESSSLDSEELARSNRVSFLLNNFSVAWKYGLLLTSSDSNSTSDDSKLKGTSTTTSGKYVHLGKKLSLSRSKYLETLKSWNAENPTYRLENWFVRPYLRQHNGSLVEVVGHVRCRDKSKLSGISDALITM
jgi:hypothetical protein